ncbi:MAG TPA: hypothetical protein QF646_06450 [Candidatus Poseidoniales archaeon]|nr:hypothetical protein [Candidatus Poseidoniales archaeon]
MPGPKIPDKRWSVDLEKRIQAEHDADEASLERRYGFNPLDEREIFVIDTPPPTQVGLGT